MKTIEINFSDKAHELISKEAELREKSVEELIANRFSGYEQVAKDSEKVEEHLARVQKLVLEKKAHAGEYWVAVVTYKKRSLGPFREGKSEKVFYRRKLKTLKRKVNQIMGYDHYKVKPRRKR